jgi:hypothetical protein
MMPAPGERCTAVFRFEEGLAPVHSFLVQRALPEQESEILRGAVVDPPGSIVLLFLTCPIGCPIWFAETLDACGDVLWIEPYHPACLTCGEYPCQKRSPECSGMVLDVRWTCLIGNCEYAVELRP